MKRFYIDVQTRGRRSTLGMVVVLARSDFKAGAVNRDLWTCGSFSEIGGSLEQMLRFGILMLSLEVIFMPKAM